MNLSFSEVINALRSGIFTAQQYSELNHAAVDGHRQKQRQEVHTFRYGEKVSFRSRSGFNVEGTVSKVNQTTVSVRTTAGQYRVPPSLLIRA